MFRQTPLRLALFALLTASGIAYALTADFFGKEMLAEAAVLAILAMSLDFVAGFGGMVSLGHAAFFGGGAYVYAVLTTRSGLEPALAVPLAALACGLAGYAVGWITGRVHGIFFIMATLAFGQMAYVYVFENRALGGDDGLPGVPRLDLSAVGIDLDDPAVFAIALVLAAAAVYLVLGRVLSSSFGQALVGIHRNEARMRALGLPVIRYKAAAFAISGATAGFGGTLAAQHTMFVSPDYLDWTASGEALVVVILGGMESLVGPALGAAIFVFLKHAISVHTIHWHFFIGLFLILTILAGGRGMMGLIESLARRVKRSPAKAPAHAPGA
jgi:branched-chain amino acid transport system permease protein